MLEKLIELLKSELCFFENPLRECDDGCVERLAERLISEGVSIVPESAIVLTRAEIEALGKYEECRMQNAECKIASDVAEEIFAEIGELINEYLDGRSYRHEFLTKIAELKKKYTEGGE